MINLYDAKTGLHASNFTHNGDMVLQPSKCSFTMELNGPCELILEHPYDKETRWEALKEEAIIGCPTPYSRRQLFRIYQVNKKMHKVIVYARHIFFDLINTLLLDTRPTLKTGEQALNIILDQTAFTGHSDITKVNTSYYIRKNVVEAICGEKSNTFIARWGGECFFDNFDIYVNAQVGEDNGVSVVFGKNLLEIEEHLDMDTVVTRIYPVGFDGITLPPDAPCVYSPRINAYAQVYTRVIKFEDVKVKEKPEDEEGFDTLAEAQAEMRRLCSELFVGGLDRPGINHKINMAQLANTTAYRDYAILETVNIGDTVRCYHPEIGVSFTARCISVDWNALTGKYNKIEIGTPVYTFTDDEEETKSRLDELDEKVNGTYDPSAGGGTGGYTGGIVQQVNQYRWEVIDSYPPANEETGVLYLVCDVEA